MIRDLHKTGLTDLLISKAPSNPTIIAGSKEQPTTASNTASFGVGIACMAPSAKCLAIESLANIASVATKVKAVKKKIMALIKKVFKKRIIEFRYAIQFKLATSKLFSFLLLVNFYCAISPKIISKDKSMSFLSIPLDSIAQKIEFSGPKGVIATAAIVVTDRDPKLVIAYEKLNNKPIVIDNENLSLSIGGMAKTESELGISSDGSLLITNQNDAVGRNRWQKTVTIVFRNGEYVVSQYKSHSFDTLDPDSESICEYNLLTGKGVLDGKAVTVAPEFLLLKDLKESHKFNLCAKW
jgi:hypothetical protein